MVTTINPYKQLSKTPPKRNLENILLLLKYQFAFYYLLQNSKLL